MPNLTTKELAGLSDQLDFERVLYSKYQTAVQETTDQELKTCFQNLAEYFLWNFFLLKLPYGSSEADDIQNLPGLQAEIFFFLNLSGIVAAD